MEKTEILGEIRRTAEANGGVPPGQQRFQSETGIRYSDWRGKHWVRWSDALREAGFAPNQFTPGYDAKELLAKYAALAQELGRLPVSGDLRLKARNDPAFPHEGAFRRLGAKSNLVKLVHDLCCTCGLYDDVVRLCEEYLRRNADVRERTEPRARNIGFVYLMKSGRFYKIGKSNHAGRREYELAIQLPEKAKTVHVIRTDDPAGIEAYWHRRFAAKRKNGEWFELDAADVAAFKRRKFM